MPSNPFEELSLAEQRAAIAWRISARAYDPRPIEEEKVAALRACCEAISAAEPCLDFHLVGPVPQADRAVGISRKMFAGSFNYYATLVIDDDDIAEEKGGYYGEQLVLLAAHMGLGTCWVAGTFKRELVEPQVKMGKNQRLLAIIPIGYTPAKDPFIQRQIREKIRGKSKQPRDFVRSTTDFNMLPEWIRRGVAAIMIGPSAVNQQPVVMIYDHGGIMMHCIIKRDRLERCDFGIAKLHWQIGAGEPGAWEWGQDARYVFDNAAE